MSIQSKALIWASIIIAAAFVANGHGLSDSASFGIIMGLTGAAWGTLNSGRSACGRGCH
ncbi:hypothetical protein ACRAQ7_04500 [Erythrobacter sp. W53]|uniref:hypothetical protein n=1 Tax=Erythrobacter sp. W53 TaxID=3425947 RepID=UPI003D7675F9